MKPEFRDYLVEYPHLGTMWTLKVRADSLDDARERLRQIGYGRVLGTVEMEIPAVGPSAVPGFICWLRNLLFGGAR